MKILSLWKTGPVQLQMLNIQTQFGSVVTFDFHPSVGLIFTS